MPGTKPTNIELEERIDLTVELLCKGLRMSAIKKALREKYGDMPARTCARYVARARARILKLSGRSKEEHRAESYAFYSSVIADPKATFSDKVRARERIDKILGLEPPQRTEFSGPNHQVLDVESEIARPQLTKQELRQIIALSECDSGKPSGAEDSREGEGLGIRRIGASGPD